MTRFIGLILTYFLFLMLLIPLSLAQEENAAEPFGELEEEKVEIEEEVVEVEEEIVEVEEEIIEVKTLEPDVEYKSIKNPRTYLSADSYTLRGVVMYPKQSYAILGTEDIIDQVMEIGNQLGTEGWKILSIHKENIVVGNPQNTDEKITIHITN